MTIPTWTQAPSEVWVTASGDPNPRAANSATTLGVPHALAWANADTLPPEAALLRRRGATVRCAPDASPEIKVVARKLRTRFALARHDAVATVARQLGLERIADALAHWPPERPITFKTLCEAASTASPDGTRLTRAARLLLALEYI